MSEIISITPEHYGKLEKKNFTTLSINKCFKILSFFDIYSDKLNKMLNEKDCE